MEKKSFGWGGDSHPAQEPQEKQNQWEISQTYQMAGKSEDFKWVAVEDEDLVVFPADGVEPGYAGLGAALEHHGPVAHGTVTISHMWTARFIIEQSLIDLETLFKKIKKWANNPKIGRKDVHHRFEISEVSNADGIPLPFNNLKTKTAADPGSGWQTVPKLWNRTDDDYRTDIQIQDNDRGKYPGRGNMRATDIQLTENEYECLQCGEIFDNYRDMLMHVSFDHDYGDQIGPEYEIRDNDETFYPDNEASRSNGLFYEAAKKKIDLEGPMPFIYDINADRIRIGEPGDEKVDVGEYNSFGMIEGYYTPDQDLIIVTQTSVPYTISHVRKLWEYMYPEFEVNHIYVIHKQEGKSVKEKVANAN